MSYQSQYHLHALFILHANYSNEDGQNCSVTSELSRDSQNIEVQDV